MFYAGLDGTGVVCGYSGGGSCLFLPPLRGRAVCPRQAVPAVREEAEAMTLLELSRGYEEAAAPLRSRLRELRLALEQARDPEEIWHLKRRIGELTPMLTEMNELAELTARYYERGFWRSEKYTV